MEQLRVPLFGLVALVGGVGAFTALGGDHAPPTKKQATPTVVVSAPSKSQTTRVIVDGQTGKAKNLTRAQQKHRAKIRAIELKKAAIRAKYKKTAAERAKGIVRLPVDSHWDLPPVINLTARPATGGLVTYRKAVLRPGGRAVLNKQAKASVTSGRATAGALRLLSHLPKSGGPWLVLDIDGDKIRTVQMQLWMTRNAVRGLRALPGDMRPYSMLIEPQTSDPTLLRAPTRKIREARVGSVCTLLPIYRGAAAKYHQDWRVLLGINQIETNFGKNLNVSSAGAVGWMQFLPSTWHTWGVDASGDGLADPWNPYDAIFSAARYLDAAGYAKSPNRAIFAYNHANWYVNQVLGYAKRYQPDYHC